MAGGPAGMTQRIRIAELAIFSKSDNILSFQSTPAKLAESDFVRCCE